MCGRFTRNYTWRQIHALYRLTSPASNLQPRFNICPTTEVDTVVQGDGQQVLRFCNLGEGSQCRSWVMEQTSERGKIALGIGLRSEVLLAQGRLVPIIVLLGSKGVEFLDDSEDIPRPNGNCLLR
jgi:hypothetical protein